MSQNNALDYYGKLGNWSFDEFGIRTESLTSWDLNELINRFADPDSRILDLGTGGGEKLLENYPDCEEILGTDFSPEMVGTARKNLQKSGRKNISFKVMDNLHRDVPDDYFDIVVARHTITDPKQIIRCLKPGGHLLIRGVDKYDCWSLKMLYGRGQAYEDAVPVSIRDYEAVLEAGFSDVELVPIHEREFFSDADAFRAFLEKVPVINICDEDRSLEEDTLRKYIEDNTYGGQIRLLRSYYGLTAVKPVAKIVCKQCGYLGYT